jgi:hypothetical protein
LKLIHDIEYFQVAEALFFEATNDHLIELDNRLGQR